MRLPHKVHYRMSLKSFSESQRTENDDQYGDEERAATCVHVGARNLWRPVPQFITSDCIRFHQQDACSWCNMSEVQIGAGCGKAAVHALHRHLDPADR